MPRVVFRDITPTTGLDVVDLPESCADPSAALDLAALSDGHLSPQGLERLSAHAVRCSACLAAFAAVVQDTQAVDATTKRAYDVKHLLEFEAWDCTTTQRYSPLRCQE